MIGLLLQALGLLTALIGYVQAVLGFVGTAAQEHAKYAIETIAANAANTVNSPTFGNAALLAAIADLKAQEIADTASLTLQIINLTDGTTPVSLPVTPPSGYQAPSSSDNASDVWNYSLFPLYAGAKSYLKAAGDLGGYRKFELYQNADLTYFIPMFVPAEWSAGVSADYPSFDPTDILSAEDILTCLARQNPAAVVTWGFADGGPALLTFAAFSDVYQWWTTFDAAGFAFIKSQVFPSATFPAAPVWPGIALVTLGSPTAISSSFAVSGPMDGVIVNISAISTNKPALGYGPVTAYKFIGALAFVSDNGDVETFQPLSFQDAVYSPKFLKSADSVVFHVDPSVAGTITPWVIA